MISKYRRLRETERQLAAFNGAFGMLAFIVAAFLLVYIALEWIK